MHVYSEFHFKKIKSFSSYSLWLLVTLQYGHVIHTSMMILNCPQVVNENGEHESVSGILRLFYLPTLLFVTAMVCERNSKLLHQSSHITGIVGHLHVTNLCTPYSILGISSCWKT